MTNIEIIGESNIKIPEGYRKLEEEETVKIDDLICHVAAVHLKEPCISWLKPETIKEVGMKRKYSGQIVIRKIVK